MIRAEGAMRLGCWTVLMACAVSAMGQMKKEIVPPLEPSAPLERLAPGIGRLSGTDPDGNMQYTRVFLTGRDVNAAAGSTMAEAAQKAALPGAPLDATLPRLTGECRLEDGKYSFRLFVSFGGETDWRYIPKYHEKKGDLPRDPIHDETLTLQFLGYKKVKPVHARFQLGIDNPGQLYYDPPALKSQNMEDASFYVQFLKSLPTLQVKDKEGHVVEFAGTAWVSKLEAEPLCRARGL